MKVMAFAASSSKQSMNKKLATYAASLVPNADVEVLDLNDFDLPLFSVDVENEQGHPEAAKQFLAKIHVADALIISFAEHNGNYSAAYKNLFDWMSRIEMKVYAGKPMILLSTSPGARGGASVMALAKEAIPRAGGDIRASFSLPSFNDNFNEETGKIIDESLDQALKEAIAASFGS